MESLHARKLSNANSFSGKNAYDGVFSGRQKYGAPVISSNVEDYREIFGRSQASSIPVLNLSSFDESNVSSSFRSSKPDYSKIFGGFRADEDDTVVSYDELFGGVKNSSEKAWTPPSTRPPLQNADKLSSQPCEGLKQFNMSYHKTPQKSKDGPDGTTHVAQLHAVPGFTCFIDETAPQPEMQSEKQKSSLANNLYSHVDCRNAVPKSKSTKKAVQDLTNQQSSGNVVKSGTRNNKNESSPDDKLLNEYEVDLKSHPPKVPSPPSEQFNLDNLNAYRKRSMASNSRVSKSDTSENAHGNFSHPSSDDELDVNSAAAASVAALRKAIQKAQESIRIAKESVGRKKEGLRSFSNLSFKDSLKVKGKMDNLAACGGENCKDNDIKEFKGVNAASEDFLELERNYKHGNGVVYPGLKDREKLFVAKKVINEMHGKILESAKTCPIATSSYQVNESKIVSDSREVTGDVDAKILESAEPVWYSGLGSMGRNPTLIGKVDNKYNNRCTDEHEFKLVENRASNETLEQDVVLKSLESVEKTSELEDHVTKRDDGEIAQELEGEMEKQESAWFVHVDKHNEKLGAGKDYETSKKKQNVIYTHENFVEKLQEDEETMENVSNVPIELENSDKDTPSNTNNTVIDENSLNESKRTASEEVVLQQLIETDFNEKKQNMVPEQEFVEVGNESGVANICNQEECEKEFEEAFQQDVHENELNNDLGTNSDKRRVEESHKGEKNEKGLDEVHELEINENRQAYAHKIEGSEANLKEVYHLKQNYEHEGEEIINRLDDVHEPKINENSTDASDMEGSEDSLEDKVDFSGDSAKGIEAKTYNTSVSIPCESDESKEHMEMWTSQEVVLKKSFDLDCDTCSNYASDDETEAQEAWKVEAGNKVETSEEFDDNSESSIEDSKSLYEFKADDSEVTIVAIELEQELFTQTAPKDQTATEDNEGKFDVNNLFKAHSSDDNLENSCLAEADLGQREGEQSGLSSDCETSANGSKEDEENMEEDRSSVGEEEEIILEDKFVVGNYKEELNVERANGGIPLVEIPNGTEASHVPKDVDKKENAMDTNEEIKEGEYYEEREELKETGLEEGGGKEYLREIDEATEKEREREREKVRLAVERAIREARERAFAEARERAERAAVEKATTEVRQRAMAGAREKLEKDSVATKSSAEIKKSSDKAAVEAKLRAERAAVERATAEARERALKAMSQKSNSGAFTDTRSKPSSSSSDLHGSNGKVSESAQRNKAKLEKHNRIMERAAKALAEKEKRDLLAQKEQVERNRLAETLDADIKRWSSGKEGNLRALLSTLQYILGPDSGWQPVTLTEIITTNAVKKAYRKATLCVHPDKLQQRGASIQQKYVCEKVFDLLKAAWNKFNPEER